MTTVTLSGVWINLASDLSQSIRLDTYQVQASKSSDGEVRKYANGRFRSITTPGAQWMSSVGFRYADRSDIDDLREWANRTVLYRDLFGRRFWATFQTVSEDEQLEYADTTKLLASVTFTQVTVDEEV